MQSFFRSTQNFTRNQHFLTSGMQTYVFLFEGKRCYFSRKLCLCTKWVIHDNHYHHAELPNVGTPFIYCYSFFLKFKDKFLLIYILTSLLHCVHQVPRTADLRSSLWGAVVIITSKRTFFFVKVRAMLNLSYTGWVIR